MSEVVVTERSSSARAKCGHERPKSMWHCPILLTENHTVPDAVEEQASRGCEDDRNHSLQRRVVSGGLLIGTARLNLACRQYKFTQLRHHLDHFILLLLQVVLYLPEYHWCYAARRG